MITPKTYLPIIKTRDGELRGVCALNQETKNDIIPLFELTKSRTTPKAPEGPIGKRIEKIALDYGAETPLGLDLTSFIDLQNHEIHSLYKPKNGFQAWTDFIAEQKKGFQQLVPTLLISDTEINTEEEYIQRHKAEITALQNVCSQFIFRTPGDDDWLNFDLENLFDPLHPPIVLLDMGFIPKDKGKIYAERAKQSLESIYQTKHGIQTVVLAGSSYPKAPTENGEEFHGENILEEVIMFKECQSVHKNLIYGDYATIYPLPNLRAGGRGWVPRIDFPRAESIVYYRDRKKIGEPTYKNAYIRVAKSVTEDRLFQELAKKIGTQNWGIKQISMAADGYPPSLSPSFWISVRINLHITLRRLILSRG